MAVDPEDLVEEANSAPQHAARFVSTSLPSSAKIDGAEYLRRFRET
jgi:hypothetical protein